MNGSGGALIGGGAGSGGFGAVSTGGVSGAGVGGQGVAGSGGMTATGGLAGTGGEGPAGGAGGVAGAGGIPAVGGSNGGSGPGGAAGCANHVLSLAANGTGSASDAADARVVVDLMSDLPIGNAPRTIEFWAYIKTTDWVGEKNEIYTYGTTGTLMAFGLDFGTNPVMGMPGNHATLDPYTHGIDGDSVQYVGITSTMNQWAHIAMTWDGTAIRIYVNGAFGFATTPASITVLKTAQTPLIIGCNAASACFNGMFSEFRVWKVARTDAEIHDNYNKSAAGTEPDLVGYWKFDDAPGSTTAADSVAAPHAPHVGMLMATTSAELPTFVTPSPPVPLICP